VELSAAPSIPSGMSAAEYVQWLGRHGASADVRDLHVTTTEFVTSRGRLCVVLGEPGAGKSMLMRATARHYDGKARVLLRRPSRHSNELVLPMLLHLKSVAPEELQGLVLRRLPEEYKHALFRPSPTRLPHLLVLCDGLDELQRADSVYIISDFRSLVLDGIPPDACSVSVIVTSRISRVAGFAEEQRLFCSSSGPATYTRAVILPFSNGKVSEIAAHACVVAKREGQHRICHCLSAKPLANRDW
jgi:hypothetical protein